MTQLDELFPCQKLHHSVLACNNVCRRLELLEIGDERTRLASDASHLLHPSCTTFSQPNHAQHVELKWPRADIVSFAE
jgi:hypothetical protein